MKFKILCITIICLTFALHAQTESDINICTYTIEPTYFNFKENIFNKNLQKNENSKMLYKKLHNEVLKYSKDFKYKLLFSNKKALFQSNNKFLVTDNFSKFSLRVLDKGTIYNNINGLKIRQEEAFGNKFLISSNINDYKWTTYNESKKIGNYVCFKATTTKTVITKFKNTKKKVTAWYCPQLPFPFGPEGFANLPGLILELHIEKEATYRLFEIELNTCSKIKIKEPTKGEKVTEEEFNKIGEKIYLQRKEIMKSM